ncbi:basic salivary proline-rich protein 1-like [Oncorhynchus masou masou]|uniref:basic salivary proline-rich protein 1-like n=1 Tax=Oncorhynchus masou masou TaxID=90313 RepID=UPI0031840F18
MGGDPAPGKYGYGAPYDGQRLGLGGDPGKSAGKYGYGEVPYEPQPLGLGPDSGKSNGKYGQGGLPYEPHPLGLGPDAGKSAGKYGGGAPESYAPEPLGLGGEGQKSAGKYGNLGPYEPQTLGSVTDGKSTGQYENPMPYEPLPLESDAVGMSYGNERIGEIAPAQPTRLEEEGKSTDKYGNGGYINGQVQPEVVSFPPAPTPWPSISYPPIPSFVPVVSFFPPEAPAAAVSEAPPKPVGTASLSLASAPSTQMKAPPHGPDTALLQPPHQIHIQQHLKLHIHPQGKSWRGGAKEKKYELTGFFGNSGY